MSSKIIECIPNFSEARRPSVLEEIKKSILEIDNINLLNIHSDTDHNRSVFTYIGDPVNIKKATFNAIKKASELIDMNFHRGAHPRIGATDVVPFVPLRNATIEDCKSIALSIAKKVGQELKIPVYLYEESAVSPDRKNLENIRRGQFEIQNDPKRKPDFGPSILHSSGATVIGARNPLIAYNVYLTSDDITIAQKIAKAIRYSSGGLRYIKAMGVLVDGKAQVSMNLTNFKKTPVHRVFELIKIEANKYGVNVSNSELVGMIPEEALIESAKWYLHLDDVGNNQILEHNINSTFD